MGLWAGPGMMSFFRLLRSVLLYVLRPGKDSVSSGGVCSRGSLGAGIAP